MKNLRIIFVTVIIALFATQASAQVQVSASVFASIPIAPNINFNIGVMTPQPRFDAVWIDGFWTFDMRTRAYVWVQGYWAIPPHPGAIWLPGFWQNTGRGFVWMNAGWAPRNFVIPYGFFSGRYDYFGRPVFYGRPTRNIGHGYAFRYDHRPEFISNRFSSDPRQNNVRSGRAAAPNNNRNSGNVNSGRNNGNLDNNRTSTPPSRNESVTPNRGNNNTRTSTPNTTTPSRNSSTTSTAPNRGSSTPAPAVNNSSSRGSSQGNVNSSGSSSRRETTASPSSSRSSNSNSGATSRSSNSSSSSRR